LDAQQHIRMTPEIFQLIEFALGFPKNVDDDIAVVKKHPTARMLTFRCKGHTSVLHSDGFSYIVGKGADLSVTRSGADHEKIRDHGVRA